MSRKSKKTLVGGVMVGTSSDGADLAVLSFDQSRDLPRVLHRASFRLPKALRLKILEIQTKQGASFSYAEYIALNSEFSDWLTHSLRRDAWLSKHPVDLLGVHGSTLFHQPIQNSKQKLIPTSLQLGNPSRWAVKLQTSVVSQFRQGDLELGGQGAPLLPKFHAFLAKHHFKKEAGEGLCIFINLGGFANCTLVYRGEVLLAFDTGPGNALINRAVEDYTKGKQLYDKNGRIAQSLNLRLSNAEETLFAHEFFTKEPPKSTGRDDFSSRWYQEKFAKIHPKLRIGYATELTVYSIKRAVEDFIFPRLVEHLPRSYLKRGEIPLVIAGGGVYNRYLVNRICEELPFCQKVALEKLGSHPQFLEAEGFAYLSFLAARGSLMGGPYTGARSGVVSAQITPGHQFLKTMEKIFLYRT